MLTARAAACTTRSTHFLSTSTTFAGAATRTAVLRRNFKPFCSTSSTTQSHPSIKTMSSNNQIIEHIVLFKVKPDADSSKVNAMVNGLNNLVSLDPVLHLSTGPVIRTRSATFAFTHMLHSRYKSKSDLTAYAQHPSHVGVVKDLVSPVVDDVMAFDWVADDVTGPVVVPPGSAMRVTFMKLKEGLGENEKDKIFGVFSGIKEKFGAIEQYTYGENFSPGRNKGFSIGSIGVFRGLSELDGLDAESELAKEEKDKVRDLLDGVLVVDYAVTPAQSASL